MMKNQTKINILLTIIIFLIIFIFARFIQLTDSLQSQIDHQQGQIEVYSKLIVEISGKVGE